MSNTQPSSAVPCRARRAGAQRHPEGTRASAVAGRADRVGKHRVARRARGAGPVLTNKYAEGYPGKRYYGGCEFADEVEALAIERVKQIFNAGYANVQPHSGAQANGSVMLALAAGRHGARHVARRGRPPDARREAGAVGQVVQRRAVRREPRHDADRLRPGRGARARAQAEPDHRRLRPTRVRSTSRASVRSPTASARS